MLSIKKVIKKNNTHSGTDVLLNLEQTIFNIKFHLPSTNLKARFVKLNKVKLNKDKVNKYGMYRGCTSSYKASKAEKVVDKAFNLLGYNNPSFFNNSIHWFIDILKNPTVLSDDKGKKYIVSCKHIFDYVRRAMKGSHGKTQWSSVKEALDFYGIDLCKVINDKIYAFDITTNLDPVNVNNKRYRCFNAHISPGSNNPLLKLLYERLGIDKYIVIQYALSSSTINNEKISNISSQIKQAMIEIENKQEFSHTFTID